MNEYDLPLTEECETCCGKCFLYFNIKSAFTYETKTCHNCGGTGNFALKKLELDYDKKESN
jgi:DnaJ-class molecular chaperone